MTLGPPSTRRHRWAVGLRHLLEQIAAGRRRHGGATTIGLDATHPPAIGQNLWGAVGGGGLPKGWGPAHDPLLPHACLQGTQRPLSVFFRSPVEPQLGMKHEDVINTLLHMRVKEKLTKVKRQGADNDNAQKAWSTLVLSVQMARLSKFVRVVQEMAAQDREVRCILHVIWTPFQGNIILIDIGDP